jgi:L-amino acid N-acyltransferase YncA
MSDYPKRLPIDGATVSLRPMTAADGPALLAFARTLPAHDLLFLRRDITRADAIERWTGALARGTVATVLAESGGALQGYAMVDRGEIAWSPHVAELRVLVAPAARGKGLGALLTREAFAIALGLGIEKMVAQMTVDQRGARAVFEAMGFRPEALLRDHVKDREGRTHDLLILSHDVRGFIARLDAYGVSEALAE